MGSPNGSRRRAGSSSFASTDPGATQETPIPVVSQVIPIPEEENAEQIFNRLAAEEELRAQQESAARKEALPGDMRQGQQEAQEFDRQADERETAFRERLERERMQQGQQATQMQGGYVPPAPTGGRPVWAAYYFTILDPSGAELTVSREVMVPGDAIVECRGNSLIIHHEGVADTFRIGRVRPA